MDAYRRRFDEMNPGLPARVKTAVVTANPQVFR